MSKITPTVDQIAADHITQLAQKYWLNQKESKNEADVFNKNLVNDIYENELVKTKYLCLINLFY